MWSTARRILRHRNLLRTLTARELKARYRGSLLGYLWSLVNPLLLLVVYTFVFSTVFDPRDESIHPYGLFLVTGLFPWIWIQASWLEGAGSLLANAGLIRKAAFPAEVLPLVPVLANLVHFALALPVIAVAYAVYHGVYAGSISGPAALLLPAIVALQLPLVAGLALGFAALNAHFKDVRDLLANLLTLLFFMTPILYTVERLESYPLVRGAVVLNPFTPFAQAYQQTVFFGELPGLGLWLRMLAIGLVAWTAGAWLFERLSGTLVEAV
jgi:ABC-type polysaccharide/polyol phosphate export permease